MDTSQLPKKKKSEGACELQMPAGETGKKSVGRENAELSWGILRAIGYSDPSRSRPVTYMAAV